MHVPKVQRELRGLDSVSLHAFFLYEFDISKVAVAWLCCCARFLNNMDGS